MFPTSGKTIPPPPPFKAPSESQYEKRASNGGRGTDDTLAVTRILEASDIPCCLVGISALIFYGAARVRPVCVLHFTWLANSTADSFVAIHQDWEICVPTEFVTKAAQLLQSEPHSSCYALVERWPYPSTSLIHTYHRFKAKDANFYFILIPSQDIHIYCEPLNITRSPRGLPYPKLSIFIQSCLDTRDETQLCDVIDGTNVSEEWGEENLDLEGFNDVEWAKDINKRGTEFENGRFAHWGPFAWDAPRSMRDMWQSLVRTKKDRLDWTKSSDVFITQYRIIDDPDPWTILSDDY
ncbi:hypothetical protein Forpe1208_v014876 [Fusarium oxysporum f. sp. rapae]|uniref:Uncharacterized protein n=1 Tax=Fusarium oxysporum f. sp. rapae TaxID=485398 RepID=A0A8J5TNJ8_FUSOX|nr:hypothetical protein Forpe1208_v014876 [Fusarium oxysporum f. sp. rapae]